MSDLKNVFKEGPYPALVAVVTTMYKGVVNATPITWFMPCSYDPPLICMALKSKSDTLQNIMENHTFVIQTIPAQIADKVHMLAKPLDRSQSELTQPDSILYTVPSIEVKPPRLEDALQWYECELSDWDNRSNSHTIITADVLLYNAKKDYNSSTPVLHFGANFYGHIDKSNIKEVPRY